MWVYVSVWVCEIMLDCVRMYECESCECISVCDCVWLYASLCESYYVWVCVC